MNLRQTVSGRRKKWSLLQKLGEGDAGEVFLVESFLEGKPAILKRPRRGSFPSDILRQAAQISMESRLLKALEGMSLPKSHNLLATPALLDQSLAEAGLGEGYFIVIEQAEGVDLKSLQRLARSTGVDQAQLPSAETYEYFLQTIAGEGQIPQPILVRVLHAVLQLLESIHQSETRDEGIKQSGLIWNDVKPEHLYWDPAGVRLTVIDWGNGKFLEADGATKDRQYSALEDYHQFIGEMGSFLAEADPELYARLDWPAELSPGNALAARIKVLQKTLQEFEIELADQIKTARRAEVELYGNPRPDLDSLEQTAALHRTLVCLGELPDFSGAENLFSRLALQMGAENDLGGFQQACYQAAGLATSRTEKWQLLSQIAGLAREHPESLHTGQDTSVTAALSAGIADDWAQLLWNLYASIDKDPLPDWWQQISRGVRHVYLGLDEDALLPEVAVRRLFYTLQTTIMQAGDRTKLTATKAPKSSDTDIAALEELLRRLNEEVITQWREIDPAPPNSGIGYGDVDEIALSIEKLLPGTRAQLGSVLAQPKAHAAIVLDSWEHQEFEIARRALRKLLCWDPTRRRVLTADQALRDAPRWLAELRQGASPDQPFYDYLSAIELSGRMLRNRIGPAQWLDNILETLRRLRKGQRPADLLIGHPELLVEIPWMNEFRSREILFLPRRRPLTISRDGNQAAGFTKTVQGVVDGRIGPDQAITLGEPLDTWAPEARGSSARVFRGLLRGRDQQTRAYAIKIMRPDQVEYALPLFKEESQILSVLNDVPGITPVVECGFLKFDEGQTLPSDESHASADHLTGSVIRYGSEDVLNFLASMDRQTGEGWLPYLALLYRDQKNNLVHYCDAGSTRGWFLPLRESLLLAIQICDILHIAHERHIMYRDHKILHYYWDPDVHGVVMIDWNIAKRQPQSLTEAERQFDLVQFGARALHHILTGRPAPGALPLGPNRPEEIESASASYTVSWTYDDERLPQQVKDLLEGVVTQGYHQAMELRMDLARIYQQIPDPLQPAQFASGLAGQ